MTQSIDQLIDSILPEKIYHCTNDLKGKEIPGTRFADKEDKIHNDVIDDIRQRLLSASKEGKICLRVPSTEEILEIMIVTNNTGGGEKSLRAGEVVIINITDMKIIAEAIHAKLIGKE